MWAGFREWWRLRRLEAAALGLAVLSGIFLRAYLASLRRTEPVLVAARDLAAGHRLTSSDVRIVQLPAGAVHRLAMHAEAEATGLVVRHDIAAQEPILRPHLASPGPGGDVAALLMPGERAVFIPWVSGSGLPVRAGDRVDAVGAWDGADGWQGHDIVGGARVLRLVEEREVDGGPGGVVLAIPQADAVRVIAWLRSGNVYLLLQPWAESP